MIPVVKDVPLIAIVRPRPKKTVVLVSMGVPVIVFPRQLQQGHLFVVCVRVLMVVPKVIDANDVAMRMTALAT